MKRILAPILLALTVTVMFSSTSFAGWTKVSKNVNGDTFYVDFERIKKKGKYVYFWELHDNLKPTELGTLSVKGYMQGDCELLTYKFLSDYYYKEPMGRGGYFISSQTPDKNWHPALPNSSRELILKKVCSR